MFRIIKSVSIRTKQLTRGLCSPTQKIIDNINNSKNTIPKLTLLESTINYLTNIIFFPFGISIVKPNHILTYYVFSKYVGYRTSGLTWIPPNCCYEQTFCGDITLDNKNMHLTDSLSNPIRVSTFVVYNIINPLNHIFNVINIDVLSKWIENITREVISKYSYHELTSEQEKISTELIKKINTDINAVRYGIEIRRAGLLEINYAPEIAETMLVRQKAKATIDARKEIVDSTLHLIEDIGEKLNDKLTQEDKSKLITCLTVSMIGNNSPSQVINLN